jgi:hypothetical protein
MLIFLHTAESAVGKGFVFFAVSWILLIGLLVILLRESKKWEDEIKAMLQSIVSPKSFTTLITASEKMYFLKNIFLFISSLVIYVSVLIKNWIQSLEISKTIAAKLFKQRVRLASENSTDSDSSKNVKDYENQFLLNDVKIDVESQKEFVDSYSDYINKKKNDEVSRKNIGFVGDSGSGKSYVFDLLEQTLESKVKVVQLKPSNRKEARDFIGNLREMSLDEKDETLYLVDDFHLLYLAAVGGFELVKEFFTIVDKSKDNISWIVSIDTNTWSYIDFIMNQTRYFSEIFKLKNWSEEEIQKLINKKHSDSDFSLSFNNMLIAMKSSNFFEDKKYVEEKYFRILWEESLGNPVIAQKMWVKSLSSSDKRRNLEVGIPHSRNESIKGLPVDFYFALASIVRHVDITTGELAKANDVHINYIRNVVEFCEDKGYLVKKRNRVTLDPLWQNNVITTLAGKNYIHGR